MTACWRRRALVLAALALTIAAPAAAVAQEDPGGTRVKPAERTAMGRTVIADGHLDMGPRFVDGRWTVQVRDDSVEPSVWRNLPDVVVQAVDAARLEVPSEPRYAFLGRPGAKVWLLPQVQQEGITWPGWNTQDPGVVSRVRREVTWRLRGVDGPGRFVLFLNESFGEPKVVFDSARRFPQALGVDLDTHVHGNWAFTAPGVYRLDVEMAATTGQGETVSDRGTLRMLVGDGDPAPAFAAAELSAAPVESGADGGGAVSVAALAGGGLTLVALAAGAGLVLRRRRRIPSAPTGSGA